MTNEKNVGSRSVSAGYSHPVARALACAVIHIALVLQQAEIYLIDNAAKAAKAGEIPVFPGLRLRLTPG
ncbi:MAG: hypothetical protein DWQ47_16265 [Acidobacteria bacterium]|nr:MAG: hypothetical protein DWQ32_03665 [Acidobacteriota bacterium]REK13807.1 MAG: hypothetical protein DWQ43_09355 [Acidobacteriota bacterium]REK41801.1 MAG: hypothetical protein DWQ47_16265 [Acidobacteriota bacterium]